MFLSVSQDWISLTIGRNPEEYQQNDENSPMEMKEFCRLKHSLLTSCRVLRYRV